MSDTQRTSTGTADHLRRIVLGLLNPMPDNHQKGCLYNDPHIHPRGPCICGYAEAAGQYLWALREGKKIAGEHYGQQEVESAVRLKEPPELLKVVSRPAQRQPRWQPIETAPKDGRAFLANCMGWMTTCHWHRHANCWTTTGPAYSRYGADEQPTHWMPLPLPPPPGSPALPSTDGSAS